MKIKAQEELFKAQIQQQAANRAQGGSGVFADMLKARMTASPAANAAAASPPAGGMIPLSGVQMTADAITGRTTALAGTERLLDLMQSFQGQLADGATTLRQMAPTVQRMADALPDLESSCDRLPTEDGLRQVATQAMVTARMEMLRFQRGDYN